MITIAAMAVMMGVLRFATPWIKDLLRVLPLPRLVPIAILGAVLFGTVVEFLVFWLYFASQRRRARRIPTKARTVNVEPTARRTPLPDGQQKITR
jgi:hypothetical protein